MEAEQGVVTDEVIVTREFKLSRGEYQRALRHLALSRIAVGLLFLWLAVAYLVFGSMSRAASGLLWATLGGWSPLLLLAAIWTVWMLVVFPWRRSGSRYGRAALQSHHYRFDADGISVALEDGSRATRPYGAIVAAEQTQDLILLEQDSGQLFVIPRYAFAKSGDIEKVLARVRPPSTDASPPPPDASTPPWPWALVRNLRAGLRLAAFRRVRAHDFSPSFAQIVLLGLLGVVTGIAAARLGIEGQADFSSYALSEMGTSYLLLAIGAYLVVVREGRPGSLLPFLVALFSVQPLFEAVTNLLHEWVDTDNRIAAWGLFMGLFLWLMAIWWRAVRSVFEVDRLRASAAMAILFAVAVLPEFWLPNTSYWYAMELDEDEPAEKSLSAEDVFYAQPYMVEEALDKLGKDRPGVVDLYFVGFGGYAHQDVFLREVNHVRDILDARFDTSGRSLVLINNRKSVDQDPIASATNLDLALHGIAQRMNPEEDVLFLYLTSHGSKRADLSVNFWPLGLNQLSAGALRRMLDESGIRWRVVVISACYSGSFLDALTDDHTLVITAASKTRTSFGCSNENEYTYFGEAYFRHGLSTTVSFNDAFDVARDWVAQREKAEKLEPSLPMRHMGSAISEHLHALEQRLESQQESQAN